METFKKEKFYIIIRRRLALHDLETYKATKSPEITRFQELSGFYDIEYSTNEGYPSTLYKTLQNTDIIFAGDVTGLITVEALIFKIPVILPHYENLKEKIEVNFVLKDMIENNLIFNSYEDYLNADKVILANKFTKVKQKWYNSNKIEFYENIYNLAVKG